MSSTGAETPDPEQAWERYLAVEKWVFGMPGLKAKTAFLGGYRAAYFDAAVRALASQAGAEPLRPALAELMACLETPLPEYEAGREAQDAWYERRDKAFKAARLALAQTKPAPEPDLPGMVWRACVHASLDYRARDRVVTAFEKLYASPIPPKGADPHIDVHPAEATNKGKAPIGNDKGDVNPAWFAEFNKWADEWGWIDPVHRAVAWNGWHGAKLMGARSKEKN